MFTGIGVIAFPVSSSGIIPLSNLVRILSRISKNVFVISSEKFMENYPNALCENVFISPIKQFTSSSNADRIKNQLNLQVQISNEIYKILNKVNLIILFMGGEILTIPAILSKLFNKKMVLLLPGSEIESAFNKKDSLLWLLSTLSYINKNVCNKIIIYSSNLVSCWNLEPYRHKILIAHRHFLDFKTFTVTISLSDRSTLIGYIGRLSGEKGIQNFAQALPTILGDRQNLRVLIGGDGQLMASITSSLQQEGITARVDLPGWITHDDLPWYLNQLRLLVLPSYTEGLPNIMLEAMACGTPVLATPVGAVPDVIVDGKTGFIMENNSPECIAENVVRALEHPDLVGIVKCARALVENEFTFDKAVERWGKILEEMCIDV